MIRCVPRRTYGIEIRYHSRCQRGAINKKYLDFGNVKIARLNGCDLNTQEGMQYFRENELLDKICKDCVKTVVKTLEEIL